MKTNDPNNPRNRRNHRSDRNGCGCPGAEDDDLFESNAWAVGIDISHHNGTVDWLTVKRAGYSFVFLKATEGATYVDATFASNRERAAAADLYVGAYHFFRPKTSSANEQARNFIRTVGTLRNGELPPVLDVEDESLWKGISSKDAIAMCTTWLKQVHTALGMKPLIYASPSFIQHVLANDPSLAEFALWLARYTTDQQTPTPAPWSKWTFWQHSEHGQVPGVTTDCDLNRFNGTEQQLAGMVRHIAGALPLSTSFRRWWLRLLMTLGL